MTKPANGKPKGKGEPSASPKAPSPAPKRNTHKRTSPDLLDFEQVGDLLNCSHGSVRRMVDLGQLPSLSVSPGGTHRMIRRVDVEDYIRNAVETRRPVDKPEPMSRDRRERLLRAGWDGIER